MKRRVEKKRFARLLAGDRRLYTRRQGRHDRWTVEGAHAVARQDFVLMWMGHEMVRVFAVDLARLFDAVEAHRKEGGHG